MTCRAAQHRRGMALGAAVGYDDRAEEEREEDVLVRHPDAPRRGRRDNVTTDVPWLGSLAGLTLLVLPSGPLLDCTGLTRLATVGNWWLADCPSVPQFAAQPGRLPGSCPDGAELHRHRCHTSRGIRSLSTGDQRQGPGAKRARFPEDGEMVQFRRVMIATSVRPTNFRFRWHCRVGVDSTIHMLKNSRQTRVSPCLFFALAESHTHQGKKKRFHHPPFCQEEDTKSVDAG